MPAALGTKMGKGKDKGGRGGGARGKQFSAPEEMESVGRQGGNRGMPSDDDDSEEEEEEPKVVSKQNPNAGMMPPSDDSDEDEDDEEDDEDDEEDDEEDDKMKLRKIFTSVGVPSEIRKELAIQLLRWKSGKDAKQPKAMQYAANAPAKKEEEEAPIDPKQMAADMAKLELVRKRREESAKKRIAADGFDRMKPLSADNHPPGTVWPPPGSSAPPADLS